MPLKEDESKVKECLGARPLAAEAASGATVTAAEVVVDTVVEKVVETVVETEDDFWAVAVAAVSTAVAASATPVTEACSPPGTIAGILIVSMVHVMPPSAVSISVAEAPPEGPIVLEKFGSAASRTITEFL